MFLLIRSFLHNLFYYPPNFLDIRTLQRYLVGECNMKTLLGSDAVYFCTQYQYFRKKLCLNFSVRVNINLPNYKASYYFFVHAHAHAHTHTHICLEFNLLTPNVNYSGRTAPLTSKVAFYIFIQQI